MGGSFFVAVKYSAFFVFCCAGVLLLFAGPTGRTSGGNEVKNGGGQAENGILNAKQANLRRL